jgi:hypothetical protein
VRAYPAAGLTGNEQGLCPQLVPRGLVYEQHHDISAAIPACYKNAQWQHFQIRRQLFRGSCIALIITVAMFVNLGEDTRTLAVGSRRVDWSVSSL